MAMKKAKDGPEEGKGGTNNEAWIPRLTAQMELDGQDGLVAADSDEPGRVLAIFEALCPHPAATSCRQGTPWTGHRQSSKGVMYAASYTQAPPFHRPNKIRPLNELQQS